MHIEERLNEGPRLQCKHKDENEIKQKQNRCNTREIKHDICKPNAWSIHVCTTCRLSIMENEPARTRLLWTILSLVLPVTFGYTIACRSPALAFSAAIHFAMKRFAPCSAVLRHPPRPWAAVVHWSVLIPKALRSSRKHPIHSFSWPPTRPALLTNSPNIMHFGSLVSSIRLQIPRTESASCALSPRCSHLPCS